MNIVSSLAMLLVLGNHAVAHGQQVIAASSDQCVRCTRTWRRTRTISPIGFVGCNQTRCGPGAQCPVGACDQRGLVNPTCTGGWCIQTNAVNPSCSGGNCVQERATNPSCGGAWCNQRFSNNPSCNGGLCDQSDSNNPSCSGGGCIYDGSRTYDADGFSRRNVTPRGMHPWNEMSIKDSRLLAEEMEPEAQVDANISSKNGSSAMTVSIATVFTALAIVVVPF